MIRLLTVKALIAALKRAITISNKLSRRAWMVLAACQCTLLVFSVWGFQSAREQAAGKAKGAVEKVRRDAQDLSNQLAGTSGTPTSEANATVINPTDRITAVVSGIRQAYVEFGSERSLYTAAGRIETSLSSAVTYASSANSYAGQNQLAEAKYSLQKAIDYLELADVLMVYGNIDNPVDYAEYFVRQHYVDFLGREPDEEGRDYFHSIEFKETGYVVYRVYNERVLPNWFASPVEDLSGLRRQIAPVITVMMSSKETNDFGYALLFWVSLFSIIVSPITSIATVTFAWISLRRRRAEELLMRLEVEKHRLEIEKLRLELERARKEYDQHKHAIMVVSG